MLSDRTLCNLDLLTFIYSSRNNGANNNINYNDREHRARERERRAAIAIMQNAIREQVQQRQQLARAGQHGGGDAGHRGAIEPYALNNSPRATVMTSSATHSLKRKLPSSFGPENVESWASTEVS